MGWHSTKECTREQALSELHDRLDTVDDKTLKLLMDALWYYEGYNCWLTDEKGNHVGQD